MVKSVTNLNPIEMDQFKKLYTKYFIEEEKRNKLGFSLLYEIITKKGSKALVDEMIDKIKNGEYLGYIYAGPSSVLGFIIGHDDNTGLAKITGAYVPTNKYSFVSLALFRRIAMEFKMRGKRIITIESSIYNDMLMQVAKDNNFDIVNQYQDGFGEYEKRI